MLSWFTLISLIGVMLGVFVLVVVMSVYAGLERQVKTRFLGYSPHILLQHQASGFGQVPPMDDWREISVEAKKIPGVQSATPFVMDNVIIDTDFAKDSGVFLGIDPSDKEQIKAIDGLLDRENHPDSSADFGIDDEIVISSRVATGYGLAVGDKVRLYSTSNIREIMQAYKANDRKLLRDEFPEAWSGTAKLAAAWKAKGDGFTVPINTLAGIYQPLRDLLDNQAKAIRQPEETLLNELIVTMETGERDEAAGVYVFSEADKKTIDELVSELGRTDPEKLDAESFKSIKNLVLPKEAKVIGIYQASMMVITPDIFMPLPLAQKLSGLDDAVQGVSLRLDDPYTASKVAEAGRKALGDEWFLLPWNEQLQFRNFSILINQQRVMMYFTLSIIMIVAAFSMMANIFTVTIQKRREIGVMKALGAAPGQIVRVFVHQGMLLGLLGAVLGIVLGRVVIHYRGPIQGVFRQFGFDPVSAAVTGSDVMPAYNNPVEQLLIGVMAFLLCILAALVPAFLASRSDAAKSLRNL
jgi:lipoprotein-releasing system permease protein